MRTIPIPNLSQEILSFKKRRITLESFDNSSHKKNHAYLHDILIGFICSKFHLDDLWEEFETQHFTNIPSARLLTSMLPPSLIHQLEGITTNSMGKTRLKLLNTLHSATLALLRNFLLAVLTRFVTVANTKITCTIIIMNSEMPDQQLSS